MAYALPAPITEGIRAIRVQYMGDDTTVPPYHSGISRSTPASPRITRQRWMVTRVRQPQPASRVYAGRKACWSPS